MPAEPALLLVRHGATDWNEAGRRQGQTDVPLNQRGFREAEAAARLLAAWKPAPAAVYSSDLRRAADTARVIAGMLGLLPVRVDARLRERSLGAAEGLVPAELEARLGRPVADLAEVGAEPVDALVDRFHAAIADLEARHPGQTVVVVSHAAVMSHWLRRWVDGWLDAHPQPLANGEVVPLYRQGRRWRYRP
ncbi:MAG: histidine phosphatase family protein [Bacillota bacterium]|nr:histidine phosphatase family protein [Bacillota bacterium]REJ33967.1 MAG: histidine phosphatase family protein [Bacillota bacterium]